MRVELVNSRRGQLVEINLGTHTIHSVTPEEALKIADWINELLRPAPKIPDRLRPLANIANELSDVDLKECIIFVAYLKNRERIINMAHELYPDLPPE